MDSTPALAGSSQRLADVVSASGQTHASHRPSVPTMTPPVSTLTRTRRRSHFAHCQRCAATVERASLTAYADEQLCPACLLRVRDMTCRYCGGEKSADPMRELCDPCVSDGFGYR